MRRKLNFLLFFLYLGVIFSLFLFSFTQVDLNLTLSKISLWQEIQKNFQYIGFFQRPVSTIIFSMILISLFIFYGGFLYLVKIEKLGFKHLKILIFLTFILLVFSYNAFSYDIFDYIFYAKIMNFYHQIPYFLKPSDFINDPMLNFMRWTHGNYPYGPTWLILTYPFGLMGMNIFLLTFFIFKFLSGIAYLGSCYLIYKISDKIYPQNKLLNVSFWAFNPLVIIESLVSGHNDVVMAFFLLLSIYLLIAKKEFKSLLVYIFSVGIKFTTGFIFPALFYALYLGMKKKPINWRYFFIFSLFFLLGAVIAATYRTTFQPWYLIIPLSMAAFLVDKYYVFIPSLVASLFSLSIYIPYVYMTDYAKGYPQVILNIEIFGLFATIVITLIYFLKIRIFTRH